MRFRLPIALITVLLTGCASLEEMGETGQAPEKLANQYKGAVMIVSQPALGREVWNFVARKLLAVTRVVDNEGINLVVPDPE